MTAVLVSPQLTPKISESTLGPDLMRTYTAEEVLQFPLEWHYELIAGRLRELSMPTVEDHDAFNGLLSFYLMAFIRERRLGRFYTAETGFLISRDPDTIKAPDFAFIRQERLTFGRTSSYAPVVSDLVVETRSPSDRNVSVLRKITEWLEAGVSMVLDLDPQAQTLTVHQPDTPMQVHGSQDTFDGGEVLPGFQLPLSELFSTIVTTPAERV